jgi:putative thioredoxin
VREEADTLAARARFRQAAALTGGEVEARRRVAANPSDLEARIALASVLADNGSYREALEGLLAVMEQDQGAYRELARTTMISVFGVLGNRHDLTLEYRPRMATVLF